MRANPPVDLSWMGLGRLCDLKACETASRVARTVPDTGGDAFDALAYVWTPFRRTAAPNAPRTRCRSNLENSSRNGSPSSSICC
eukprot:scaffold289367_cov49-Attheya_sp.AAC.2